MDFLKARERERGCKSSHAHVRAREILIVFTPESRVFDPWSLSLFDLIKMGITLSICQCV